MSQRERGFLLLTSHLGDPERKVLTVAQLRSLALRMRDMEQPMEDRNLTERDLLRLGCDVEPTEDGMIIHGGKPLHGAVIDSKKDHRIAMSFAIAGGLAEGDTEITGAECVNISYPTFYSDLEMLMR